MFVERIEAAREAERAGLWQEALERYEDALRLLPGRGTAPEAARVLRWMGTIHRERGDLALAEEAYQTSLEVAEQCESIGDSAAVWNCLAIIAQYRGKFDEAEELYARAHELADQAEDIRLMAMIDQNRGTLSSIRGNEAMAIEGYHGALTRYRQLGDDRSAAGALTNIGKVFGRMGDASRAEEHLTEAVKVAEKLGDAGILCHIDLNHARLHIQRQQFGEARESCDRAFAGMSRMGSSSGLAAAHKLYGMLYRDTGESELSEDNLSKALSLAQKAEDRLLQAETWAEWARLHEDNGRTHEALVATRQAHQIFQELHPSRDTRSYE